MAEYNPKNAYTPLKIKLLCLLWSIVNVTLFRYSPFFCHGWRRFLLRCFGAKIASTATIGRTAVIDLPWNLTMGERAMICRNAWVACSGPVELGNQALVGEYVKIITGSHAANSKSFRGIASGIVLKENCWVCTNAMLVSGGRRKLTIGAGAIVGAGAVVFLSVGANEIVMGNPARCVGERTFTED